MYVKVTVTAEDGETDDDVTVLPVAEASGQIMILSAEAKAVNEIEVLLSEAVNDDDTVVTLTKESSDISIESVEWDDANKVATITTSSKLSNGTYTVTLTSEEDPTNTDSEDFEVVDQYAKDIIITTDTALTKRGNHTVAYAGYDVLDQYGKSIRTSTSITWAGSCKITGDKTTGRLTLRKTSGEEWVYNEKIYVTGVNVKTGATASETLTVGTEQALDTLEIKGFLKKGDSKIIDTLPKDFKSGTYYLLFNAYDQEATKIGFDDLQGNDITFVSNEPLIVKEVSNVLEEKTVAGETYLAALVEPGIKVSEGGAVTIEAIANRTGNKDEITINVGEDRVVASFVMSNPKATVADGDTDVEIPFVAKDEAGKEITDFLTLAKQETFNTLSFNASEGKLVLAEQDDGSAKLLWSDASMDWSNAQSTDGIDRPISLTAIVVGGDTANELIYVSDKRRPTTVYDANVDSVLVEGAEVTFTTKDSFKFLDQYDKQIGTAWGADNGFFAAATAGSLKGTDFAGFNFGVKVVNAGSGEIVPVTTTAESVSDDGKEFIAESGKNVKFATKTDIKSAATGEGFKFAIAKFKSGTTGDHKWDPADWEILSTTKYKPVMVVDITQVKNLKISDLNTFYVGGLATTVDNKAVTGNGIIGDAIGAAGLKDTPISVKTDGGKAGIYAGADYDQAVVVKGTYSGTSVTVPTQYYTIEANKMLSENSVGVAGDRTFDGIISYNAANAKKGLQAADLYDKTSAKGTAILANDEVTATVYQLYSDEHGEGGYFWSYDDAKHEFVKKAIPDGARETTIATLLSEANATLTSEANIKDAQDQAKATAQLAAVNGVLTGAGYDAITDPDSTTAGLKPFLDGTDDYANRDLRKGTTESTSDAAKKLAKAVEDLEDAEDDVEDASAALGTANTTTAKTFIPELQDALNAKPTDANYAAKVTAATTVTDGAIEAAVAANRMQLTDDLRKASIDYITAKRDQLVKKAALEATAVYGDAGKKAKADALATDAELKALDETKGEITDLVTDAVSAGKVEATDKANTIAYLKAKQDNLKALDVVTATKAELNAIKAGSSDKADTLAAGVTAATTDAQIKALDYKGAGLAPKEEAAEDYLVAVRDMFKAQDAVITAQKNYRAWVEDDAVKAADKAWTDADNAAVKAKFDEKLALNNANKGGIPEAAVYDTAKTAITLSDQAPKAAQITGLAETYTFNPAWTVIDINDEFAGFDPAVVVVDQYGVKFSDALVFTVTNVKENPDAYAANNFKVTGNSSTETSIEGAERGDTFTLVVSYDTIKAETAVTVGADKGACIVNGDNYYTAEGWGLKATLESQRKAGLG